MVTSSAYSMLKPVAILTEIPEAGIAVIKV
jgi:hypothetical protein